MDEIIIRGRTRNHYWNAVRVIVLLVASSVVAAPQGPSEYQVKAAYLTKFTRFVAWPSSAFESPASPLTICILGDNPFGEDIDRLVEGETVKGRKVAVVRLRRAPTPRTCQVLFISKSEKDVPMLLAGLGTGILTVSDRDRFLLDGGMIALVLENQHVRFDVNQRAAVMASLTIDALMLNVARSVQK
jgi:hypothetical protein